MVVVGKYYIGCVGDGVGDCVVVFGWVLDVVVVDFD